MMDRIIDGELIENRVVIWDIEDSRTLFSKGYYGKPIGIPKPKGIQFESPLILDLIESYYLKRKKEIRIHKNNKEISLKTIKQICAKQYEDFELKYIVFKDLRDKGYIVSPGIKFGCDFAVYERGPGIDHAPFLVQILKKEELLTATNIVLAGRLATTVKKQYIIAVPRIKDKHVEFIGFDWWRA